MSKEKLENKDIIDNCSEHYIHKEIVDEAKKSMTTREEYMEISKLFSLFGNETRIRILHALEIKEMCVCDLSSLLDMTKSAISHQLKDLRLSNLVKFRKEGKVVYYSLADDHVKNILDIGFEHIRE